MAPLGPVWLRGALSAPDLAALDRLFGDQTGPGRRIASAAAGLMAVSGVINVLRTAYVPVRLIGFDKTASSNWHLPWHQDRVIAVNTRASVDGYDNWSQKRGIWHCEPPLNLLSRMLFARVFLDSCDADPGGMEFAKGSHFAGRVGASEAADVAGKYPKEVELADRGDVLVLPMLTLHRSGRAQQAGNRRVLRVDFADFQLPPPLDWMATAEADFDRA